VRSISVSHDSQWVISGSDDQTVRFWDLCTGEALLILHGHIRGGWSSFYGCSSHCSMCACMHPHIVISVNLSPTGGMLATSGLDGRVKLCASLSLVCTRYPC
jgi:WD domain, G-beta repeat